MDCNPISQALGPGLAPARLAGRVAAAREATGGRREPEPPPRRPKDLDDVAIARKVESVIFRSRTVAKGKVDVNVADGVVWLRGKVKTPDLVRQLEAKAREVPEVKGVENLLHLPKTPAPSRTDTPASQRKTRRTKPRPGARKISSGNVSEEAPAPAGAEPTPKAVSAAGGGASRWERVRPPPDTGTAVGSRVKESLGAGYAGAAGPSRITVRTWSTDSASHGNSTSHHVAPAAT